MRVMTLVAAMGIASLTGCELADIGGGSPDGSVSKAAYKIATSKAQPLTSIPMRGQRLNVSRSLVAGKDFAVIKFAPGLTTRMDQPDMLREVFPAVERVTGCTVLKKGAFGVAYFMPRNTDVALPLSCNGGFEPVPQATVVRELLPLRDDPNQPI